jgi:hypothetical protein
MTIRGSREPRLGAMAMREKRRTMQSATRISKCTLVQLRRVTQCTLVQLRRVTPAVADVAAGMLSLRAVTWTRRMQRQLVPLPLLLRK